MESAKKYNSFSEFVSVNAQVPESVISQKLDTITQIFDQNYQCSICLENINPENPIDIPSTCKHAFCSSCMDRWITEGVGSNRKCPLCATNICRLNRFTAIPVQHVQDELIKPITHHKQPSPAIKAQIEKKKKKIARTQKNMAKVREQITRMEALLEVQQCDLNLDTAELEALQQ